MDRVIVERKLDSLRRCVQRVRDRCPADVNGLRSDVDAQDVVVLNLSRAIQLCVDLAAHALTERALPPPDTMGRAFEQLADTGIVNAELAGRLRKAVGFRNIAVHAYDVLDWDIVFAIAARHLEDFESFGRIMASTLTRGNEPQ